MFDAPYNQIPKSQLRPISIKKGERLFSKGSITAGLFYVKSGTVDLTRNTLNGELIIIHRATKDNFFAEASLFCDYYHCDAVASVDSNLLEFNRTYLLSQFKTNPQFSFDLAKQFTIQLQQSRNLREILAIKSATERTLIAICEGLLENNLTSFANLIGLTHEALYRSLSELVKRGKLIKTSRGVYELTEK